MSTFDQKSANVYALPYADARRSVRHVFVRDYQTPVEIGVYDHEKGDTQPVRINVDLSVQEGETHHGDDIGRVVCYNEVVTGIEAIIAAGHINLVETLAEQIAEMALNFDDVICSRVRVEKLAAIEKAASVGVEIERYKTS